MPTYNRARDLPRTIEALARQTVGELDLIVVDNSSTDDTEAVVNGFARDWNGRLLYIRKDPEGPAAARNVGLAAARTEYVLFIDSDVVLEAPWLERASAHLAADPGLGAVGGYILYAFDPSRVNAYGGDLGYFGLAWDVDEDSRLPETGQPQPRVWINCSATLARAAAVRKCGGFDPTFFYGYEDSDLGWRLNLQGDRVAVFPDLRALHFVDPEPGPTHPQIVFHYCKNRLRALLRNGSGASLVPRLAAYGAYTLVDLIARGPRQAKLQALYWNLRRGGETLALRRATQALRVVPDRRIFALGEGRWFPPTPLAGNRRRPVATDGAIKADYLERKGPGDDRV